MTWTLFHISGLWDHNKSRLSFLYHKTATITSKIQRDYEDFLKKGILPKLNLDSCDVLL